jgi:hypothetical protein
MLHATRSNIMLRLSPSFFPFKYSSTPWGSLEQLMGVEIIESLREQVISENPRPSKNFAGWSLWFNKQDQSS